MEKLGKSERLQFAGQRTRKKRAEEKELERWADGPQVFSGALINTCVCVMSPQEAREAPQGRL